MDWKEHKKKLLEDPEFKKEYEALATEYKAVSTAIRRRLKRSAASAPKTKVAQNQYNSPGRRSYKKDGK